MDIKTLREKPQLAWGSVKKPLLATLILLLILWIIWYLETLIPWILPTLELSESTFFLSSFTSIFLHKNLEHICSNSVGILISGVIVMHYLGIKRGVGLYILCGYGGHMLEMLLVNFLNYYYLGVRELFFLKFGTTFERPAVLLKGKGASGSIMGWFGFLTVLFTSQLISTDEKSKYLSNIKNFSFLFVQLLIVLVGVVLSLFDLLNFLALVLPSIFHLLDLPFIKFGNSIGNPLMAHLMAYIIGGIYGLIYLLTESPKNS